MKLKLLVIFAIIGFIFSCNLTTPISPGELNQAHADLEGTSNCTKCHVLGKWVSEDKCLDCHQDIKTLIENEKGYHSSEEVHSKKCFDCHSEHHGRGFEIIHFDTLKFDHKLTSYELKEKHEETFCTNCHKPENIHDDSLKLKEETFLGLQQTCLSCHADYHQETLPETCQDCHDFKGFTPVAFFDHDKTDYPLKGKHIDVKCEKCHKKTTRNEVEFQEFAGIKFDHCINCHKDEHNGKFGKTCEDCHSVNSFTDVNIKSSFDHNLTGYILEGKHTDVACKDCHTQKYTTPIAHANCKDCHEDYHKGEFNKKGRTTDCKDCHNSKGFKVPQYTIAQHNKSSFPLIGAHEATPCLACHNKNDKWVFSQLGTKCVDCHKNIHKDFMSAKYYPQESCQTCHTSTQWQVVKFDHSKTDFALLGKHQQKTCKDCHYKPVNGKPVQKFADTDKSCIACHTDEHAAQFAKNGTTDCASCHTSNTDNWKISNFNHDNTRFKLDGKHVNVACAKCHTSSTVNSKKVVKYKLNKLQCTDCH